MPSRLSLEDEEDEINSWTITDRFQEGYNAPIPANQIVFTTPHQSYETSAEYAYGQGNLQHTQHGWVRYQPTLHGGGNVPGNSAFNQQAIGDQSDVYPSHNLPFLNTQAQGDCIGQIGGQEPSLRCSTEMSYDQSFGSASPYNGLYESTSGTSMPSSIQSGSVGSFKIPHNHCYNHQGSSFDDLTSPTHSQSTPRPADTDYLPSHDTYLNIPTDGVRGRERKRNESRGPIIHHNYKSGMSPSQTRSNLVKNHETRRCRRRGAPHESRRSIRRREVRKLAQDQLKRLHRVTREYCITLLYDNIVHGSQDLMPSAEQVDAILDAILALNQQDSRQSIMSWFLEAIGEHQRNITPHVEQRRPPCEASAATATSSSPLDKILELKRKRKHRPCLAEKRKDDNSTTAPGLLHGQGKFQLNTANPLGSPGTCQDVDTTWRPGRNATCFDHQASLCAFRQFRGQTRSSRAKEFPLYCLFRHDGQPCEAVFDKKESWLKHLMIKEPQIFYECPIAACKKIFTRHFRAHLKVHVGGSDPIEDLNPKSYIVPHDPEFKRYCGFCGKEYKSWNELHKEHIYKLHFKEERKTTADFNYDLAEFLNVDSEADESDYERNDAPDESSADESESLDSSDDDDQNDNSQGPASGSSQGPDEFYGGGYYRDPGNTGGKGNSSSSQYYQGSGPFNGGNRYARRMNNIDARSQSQSPGRRPQPTSMKRDRCHSVDAILSLARVDTDLLAIGTGIADLKLGNDPIVKSKSSKDSIESKTDIKRALEVETHFNTWDNAAKRVETSFRPIARCKRRCRSLALETKSRVQDQSARRVLGSRAFFILAGELVFAHDREDSKMRRSAWILWSTFWPDTKWPPHWGDLFFLAVSQQRQHWKHENMAHWYKDAVSPSSCRYGIEGSHWRMASEGRSLQQVGL